MTSEATGGKRKEEFWDDSSKRPAAEWQLEAVGPEEAEGGGRGFRDACENACNLWPLFPGP